MANALGSCIAVILYDIERKIGGVAHIMLPGKAPKKINDYRYAENGVKEILSEMLKKGAHKHTMIACLIGAGNVLKRNDDTICDSNIRSVHAALASAGIAVEKEVLGGNERRRARMEIESGKIYYSENGYNEEVLWDGK
ncbi:chemotaxis protein CheD [Spirochaetota bacterium]